MMCLFSECVQLLYVDFFYLVWWYGIQILAASVHFSGYQTLSYKIAENLIYSF